MISWHVIQFNGQWHIEWHTFQHTWYSRPFASEEDAERGVKKQRAIWATYFDLGIKRWGGIRK